MELGQIEFYVFLDYNPQLGLYNESWGLLYIKAALWYQPSIVPIFPQIYH